MRRARDESVTVSVERAPPASAARARETAIPALFMYKKYNVYLLVYLVLDVHVNRKY